MGGCSSAGNRLKGRSFCTRANSRFFRRGWGGGSLFSQRRLLDDVGKGKRQKRERSCYNSPKTRRTRSCRWSKEQARRLCVLRRMVAQVDGPAASASQEEAMSRRNKFWICRRMQAESQRGVIVCLCMYASCKAFLPPSVCLCALLRPGGCATDGLLLAA